MKNIQGIKGKFYFDLSPYVDLADFDLLHPDICKGIATARNLCTSGMVECPEGRTNIGIYNNSFIPLFKANETFNSLDESNPYKVAAQGLKDNDLAVYLKYAFGGYDLYSFYVICDFFPNWKNSPNQLNVTETGNHFPKVVTWIQSLMDKKIFSHVSRAIFFVQEAGGISIEHSDDYLDSENLGSQTEFIHIRPNLDRPFYIRNNETNEKVYINTRVAYWNDQDFHGGDPVLKPTYSFRVDGIFTKEFRETILK